MKKNIHPDYYHDTQVTCACGNSFVTGSVLKEIKVQVCSQCHPFYTGEKRFVDTEGRVDKFIRRRKIAQEAKKSKTNPPSQTRPLSAED